MTTPTPDEICERLQLIAKASNDYAWFLTHNPNAEPAEFLHAIREWAEAILPIAETPTEAADLIQQQQATIERLSAALEHLIDIIDGTEATGFDPHVEQMLMDAAETGRAALGKDVSKK